MSTFIQDLLTSAAHYISNGSAQEDKDKGKSVAPPAFSPTAQKGSYFPVGPKSLHKCLEPTALSNEALADEIEQIKVWLAENSGHDKKELLESALTQLVEEKEYRDNYDKVTPRAHKQKGLMGDQGEMTRAMLEVVGYKDPEKWYKEMVSIQFFGQTAKGIRPEFAHQLKIAESKTLEKLGEEDPALKDPRRAAKYLGINENYKTSRIFKKEKPEYQSMHLFGLAIDINFINNPWITPYAGKWEGTKANINLIKGFIQRIDALYNTENASKYSWTDANEEIKDSKVMEEIFDGLSGADQQVEKYFALLGDDEKLQEALDNSNSPKWKGKSLSKARNIIKQDLNIISAKATRKGKGMPLEHQGKTTFVNAKENFAKQGFMDLDKRLVMSMHEAKLDWGGKYGDMMHFDMRFEGIGNRIHNAKNDSKVRKLKKTLKAQ